MTFWNKLFDWLNGPVGTDSLGNSLKGADSTFDCPSVNPATGMPMIDGCGGLDLEGNPFGTDLHQFDDFWSTSGIEISDDSWMSTSGSWDDSFSND
jgi:hypothetical protein